MLQDFFKKNESLARHTNFRIGGPAKYFFEAKSSDDIIKAVEWALQHGEQFFILGGGSNVLVSDKGFRGIVIKAANRSYKIEGNSTRLDSSDPRRTGSRVIKVTAEAGALSALLARKTAEAGLTGFLWAISLPGTIGGAIRGNAGCFGGETKDVVKSVQIFNSKKATSYKLQATSCNFKYRDSIFKHQNPSPVILSAELELQEDDPQKCLAELDKNITARKEKQPLYAASAGCIFKNYELGIMNKGLNPKAPKEFLEHGQIPAGWLIEKAGLKGLRAGDAEVSEKHGNFVVNTGHATAQDFTELIKKVKNGVFNKFGIELQEEIQYVGKF